MKVKRQLFIRLGAVLVILILAIVMFVIGKQHTILVDNFSQGDYKALDYFEVSVDGSALLDMSRMMREQFVVTGQKHNVVIQWEDEASGEMLAVSFDVKIPLMQDMVLLSVPVFMADMSQPQSVWLTPFEVKPVVSSSAEDNVVVTDDTASFSSF